MKFKKNEFKRKEIKKTKDQAKTETKMNANRDAQKQKSDEKRMQETLDKRKKENVFHERDSFLNKKKRKKKKIGKYKRDKTNKRSSCSQKCLD